MAQMIDLNENPSMLCLSQRSNEPALQHYHQQTTETMNESMRLSMTRCMGGGNPSISQPYQTTRDFST
jgi:hypothetical protein